MNNGEKLIARILSDAQQEAHALEAAAQQEKEAALTASRRAAETAAAQILQDAQKKAQAVTDTARSSAERTVRSALLRQRRMEIDETVLLALAQIKALPEEEYFGLLLQLIKAAATGQNGVLLLDPADLQRVPSAFIKEMEILHITVNDTGAAMPDGGFILRYGQIEINNRFGARAAEKKEQLEDFINQELFA